MKSYICILINLSYTISAGDITHRIKDSAMWPETLMQNQTYIWENTIVQALFTDSLKQEKEYAEEVLCPADAPLRDLYFCRKIPINVYNNIKELLYLHQFKQDKITASVTENIISYNNNFKKWKKKYSSEIEEKFPHEQIFLIPYKLYYTKPARILLCKIIINNKICNNFYFYFSVNPYNYTAQFIAPPQFDAIKFFDPEKITYKKTLLDYTKKPPLNLVGVKFLSLKHPTPSDEIMLDNSQEDFNHEKKDTCLIM